MCTRDGLWHFWVEDHLEATDLFDYSTSSYWWLVHQHNTDVVLRAADRPLRVCVSDEDECASEPCGAGRGTCINTDGAYQCHCHHGYKPMVNHGRLKCVGESHCSPLTGTTPSHVMSSVWLWCFESNPIEIQSECNVNAVFFNTIFKTVLSTLHTANTITHPIYLIRI